MDFTIGITTAPRRRPYLSATCISLYGTFGNMLGHGRVVIAPSAADDRVLAAASRRLHGRSIILPAMDEVHGIPDVTRGLERNHDRLIRHLLDAGGSVFLTIQDDIQFCTHAGERIREIAEWLAALPEDNPIGIVSFYTPYNECGAYRRALWPYPGHKFYGELAVLWRAAAAKDFLEHSNHSVAHDLAIQSWLVHGRWRAVGHSPCLVQHRGVVSASGKPDKLRMTQNFRQERSACLVAKPLGDPMAAGKW